MSEDLVIAVPVLDRPGNVTPLLESIRSATPHARVVFAVSRGDEDELEAVSASGEDFVLTSPEKRYAAKINAIIEHTDEPWIFTGADDLDFHQDWFEAAKSCAEHFGVGVVGTQDLCNPKVKAGQHATHFLVSRQYAEKHAPLLHEGYHHWYVDNELLERAEARRQYSFCATSIVEHLHPLNGRAEMDRTYEIGGLNSRKDQSLFLARRHLWSSDA